MVLVQLELAPQSFNVELAHSSISINKAWIVFTKNGGKNQTKTSIPVQFTPFPVKPTGQVHVKLERDDVQMAYTLQLFSVELKH